MMLEFSIKPDLEKAKPLLERSSEIFREEKRTVLTEAGLILEREWASRAPHGVTSLYAKSIEASPVYGDRVEIGTSIEYAEPLEYGAKAHWAPLEALEQWGLRKLGSQEAGRAVWYSIAKKGMRPHLVATRALSAAAGRIESVLRSIADRIAKRFNA